jgi:hypothetical protein
MFLRSGKDDNLYPCRLACLVTRHQVDHGSDEEKIRHGDQDPNEDQLVDGAEFATAYGLEGRSVAPNTCRREHKSRKRLGRDTSLICSEQQRASEHAIANKRRKSLQSATYEHVPGQIYSFRNCKGEVLEDDEIDACTSQYPACCK